MYNSGEGRFFGPRFGLHGKGKCPAETGAGQCFVKFFLQPFPDESNYQIVDTDYDNYSIIYACEEDGMQYMTSSKANVDELTALAEKMTIDKKHKKKA